MLGVKHRKNLYLSRAAIAKGEQLALESRQSFSAIVEAQLLTAPVKTASVEDYWPGPALKPLALPGDRRSNYLKRKHGA